MSGCSSSFSLHIANLPALTLEVFLLPLLPPLGHLPCQPYLGSWRNCNVTLLPHLHIARSSMIALLGLGHHPVLACSKPSPLLTTGHPSCLPTPGVPRYLLFPLQSDFLCPYAPHWLQFPSKCRCLTGCLPLPFAIVFVSVPFELAFALAIFALATFTVQSIDVHRHRVCFSCLFCAWCFPRLTSTQIVI